MIPLTIYVVKPKDTVYSIAREYGLTPDSIISANRLVNPGQLVVGQSLVLPTAGRSYTVKSGDTIYSIARVSGVSQSAIFRANPGIGPDGRIVPGQVIIIPAGGKKLGTIEVNGYVFPNSNAQVVSDALPSLTYLSVFSYEAGADGSLSTIDDSKWITLAKQNHVAPMMVVTNIRESGGFSSDIGHALLTDMAVQQRLIDNIVSVMKQKGYYGLNIDFEYIFPNDREAYNAFLRTITPKLNALGYIVMTAVAPKISAAQRGTLYEAHDYPVHGATVDRVIIMTYEWGYLAGPPEAVAPLNDVKQVLDYAVTAIPPSKILMGVPNYGYDWVLPYVRGTLATTFSNVTAVDRAFQNGADIRFDPVAQSPYYNYYDSERRQHIVWFEDARSIQAKLQLVSDYKLAGVSYWTIERAFPQNLLVLNSMYDIKKVI